MSIEKPDYPDDDVTLENIRLFMPGGGTREHAAKAVEENADAYPEASMFGTLPSYGLYCRHVDGLQVHNMEVQAAKTDARSALLFDDVKNLRVDGFRAVNPVRPDTVVRCHNVRYARFSDCRTANEADRLFDLRNGSDHIDLIGNDFSECRDGFMTDVTVPAGAVYTAANRG